MELCNGASIFSSSLVVCDYCFHRNKTNKRAEVRAAVSQLQPSGARRLTWNKLFPGKHIWDSTRANDLLEALLDLTLKSVTLQHYLPHV